MQLSDDHRTKARGPQVSPEVQHVAQFVHHKFINGSYDGRARYASRKIPGRHDVFFLVPLSKQFVHEYLADTDNLGNV